MSAHREWQKSRIGCGRGPYTVEELPGTTGKTGSFYVADAGGTNCWTRGTGQIATTDRDEAQKVVDEWNGEEKS